MKNKKKLQALKAAFPLTLPVMAGYLFLGMAFGILLGSQGMGYHFLWAFSMSVIIFAGSMQFVAVELLVSAATLPHAALITLLINARHLFYGLSMLEKYKDAGKKKFYLIFGLTDETYSLITANEPPQHIDRHWFYFFITLLDQCYWVIGATIGNILGSNINFNSDGIEFVMTALFLVIFLNQWMESKNHWSALLGLAASFACLLLFGADNFIIPSMIAIIVLLTIFKKPIDRRAK